MRAALLILFTLLIQMGLLGRALAIIPCCPDVHAEHHGHHSDDDHEDEGDGHDHHHAACVHNLLVLVVHDVRHGLKPPHAESMPHARHHKWPPDKPFLALIKPPLI